MPGHWGAAARKAIDEADEVLASVVSLWEIAIKFSVGKLLHVDARLFIAQMAASDLRFLSPTPADCQRYLQLPLHHRDPFDRMLVAQALEQRLTVLTSDRKFMVYVVETVRGR